MSPQGALELPEGPEGKWAGRRQRYGEGAGGRGRGSGVGGGRARSPHGHRVPSPALPATSAPCREWRNCRDTPTSGKPRPGTAPMPRRPIAGLSASASPALHCYANIKEVKGAPARRAGESSSAWRSAWGPCGSHSRSEQGPESAASPLRLDRPPASAAPAPVARSAGRGWMRRGPRSGGPRPPAPGAPRGGVRGLGAPRPPCAQARPETAGGPRRSRRPR